jgi:hypothetical protein
MDIKGFLRGYKPDVENVQIAGNMVMIPLVSEQEFTSSVGEADSVQLRQDIDYGNLSFENQSGNVGIVMQGATILTKQHAQDRTVPRAHILKGKATANVNAFCVQSDQGGYINASQLAEEYKDEEVPFMILPPSLRASALIESRDPREHQYNRMWNTLESYTGSFSNLRSTAAIKNIYEKYKDALDEFVAQFEPVPQQLGSIVLIDGAVAGVDIMPTYLSWKKMWRSLIRDSYGAEAVRTADKHRGTVFNYNLKMDDITDLDSLEAEMHRAVEQLVTAVRMQWSRIDKESVVSQAVDSISGIELVNVESGSFFGQAVVHDEHCVYLSLVPKGSTRGPVDRFRRGSSTYSNDDFSF